MNKVKNKLVSLFAFAAMAVVLIGCEGGGKIDPNAVGKWKSGMGTIELTSDGKIIYGEQEYCQAIQEISKSMNMDVKCSYKIASNTITLTGTGGAENKEFKDAYSYTVDGDALNITIEGKPEGSSFNGKWSRVK